MKRANSRYFPFNWRAIGAAEDGVRQFMALKGPQTVAALAPFRRNRGAP